MACNKFLRHPKLSFTHTFNHIHVRNNSQAVLQLIIKEVASVKFYERVPNRSYSVFSKQSWNSSRNLSPVSISINSKLFMSTSDISDKYHVVVTDPTQSSASVTDFSPGISKLTEVTEAGSVAGSSPLSVTSISDLSGAATTADLSDTAVTLSSELSTAAAQLIEPSLASLGLGSHYTPVGWVQMFLEYLHVGLDMPWWAAIAASTVVARILLLPILIKTQKNAVKMSNNMPQLQYLQAKFGEARKSGNSIEASRYASEIMLYMKEHDVNPFKSAMLPLLQAPVFVSFFMGLRAMAKAPVESMTQGGIWWAVDMTIPDPYYIMPVVACGTLYIVLKIGAESGVRLENLKMAKYVMQAIPVIALPFCINFPAAILYYWVTTNFCTLAIVSILKIKPLRKFLNLPIQKPINPKFVLPKRGFVAGVKEAFEDQKILGAIEDRRRTDEVRFLKAGTGPIPRTYSYDPTKPRPANAAATAKKQHVVSAKER